MLQPEAQVLFLVLQPTN